MLGTTSISHENEKTLLRTRAARLSTVLDGVRFAALTCGECDCAWVRGWSDDGRGPEPPRGACPRCGSAGEVLR